MAETSRSGVRYSAPGNSEKKTSPRRRPAALVRFALALAFVVLLAGSSASRAAPLHETVQQNQAGLVVVHGDGRVVTRCVNFEPAEISGYELLQSSGLDLGVAPSGMGASICRLDGEGCSPPGQSCFCECMSSPCIYWSYWRMNNGQWEYSNLGAASGIVRPGDVDGWVWAEGIIGREAEIQPPAHTFEQICARPTSPPTSTSTAIPAATPTTVSTESGTSAVTVTPFPTATSTPTWTPVRDSRTGDTTGDAPIQDSGQDSGQDVMRVRLPALVMGSLLVVGAPLLFAFVWVTVWAVWRKP